MASPRHRALLRGLPLCALTALLLLGAASAAIARSPSSNGDRAALAMERYYSSYGSGAAQPADDGAALAAERYYSSYGAPEPRASVAATVAATGDGGGPSWTAAILAGVLVAVAAAGAGVFAGRSSRRPRHAGA